MNGRTGRKNGDTVVGNFGEDKVNDNGERLIEIFSQTSLKIWNGLFNHKNIRKYTWEQHTKTLETVIDYIITKQDKNENAGCSSLQRTKLWDRPQTITS
jgi:hypothetical protein